TIKLVDCLVDTASILESIGVIEMRSCIGRKIGDDCAETFKLGPRAVHLPKPECSERNNKDSHPFGAVRGPAWKKTTRRNVDCAATDAKRLASGFLSYFPDESIIVKMKKRGCGHHASENALNGLDSDTRLEITQRPVGEDQA